MADATPSAAFEAGYRMLRHRAAARRSTERGQPLSWAIVTREETDVEILKKLALLAARRLQASVVAVGVAMPPAAPAPGEAWIVGPGAGGAWAGQAGAIAAWTSADWRFVGAREGMTAWSIADRRDVRYSGGAWTIGELRGSRVTIDGVKVVGARGAAIAAPTGGTTVDKEARATIGAVLAMLRGHGLIAE